MNQIPAVLKGFEMSSEGEIFGGKVDEIVLPKLTVITEEHRSGGMDQAIEIDMGLEKMEASWTMAEHNIFYLKRTAAFNFKDLQVSCRGSIEGSAGVELPVKCVLRGMIKEADFGSWKPKEKTQVKFMMAVRFYELTINKTTIHKIAPLMTRRVIDGVDQLEARRTNLGYGG